MRYIHYSGPISLESSAPGFPHGHRIGIYNWIYLRPGVISSRSICQDDHHGSSVPVIKPQYNDDHLQINLVEKNGAINGLHELGQVDTSGMDPEPLFRYTFLHPTIVGHNG